MSDKGEKNDESSGAAYGMGLMVGIVAISIGIGILIGAGWGWLSFGLMIASWVIVEGIVFPLLQGAKDDIPPMRRFNCDEFRWKNIDDWRDHYLAHGGDPRGFAHPIVREAFEAGRKRHE